MDTETKKLISETVVLGAKYLEDKVNDCYLELQELHGGDIYKQENIIRYAFFKGMQAQREADKIMSPKVNS